MAKKRKCSVDENGTYIEPADYFPKELRKKFKFGDYDDEYDDEEESENE